MRVRHILALGVVFGVFGGADLQRAQAQSVRQVRFLLLQENRGIAQASILIARQNFAIGYLNVLYTGLSDNLNGRQSQNLIHKISSERTQAFNLERRIEALQLSLSNLDNKTLSVVQSFDPDGVTPYTVQAFNNDNTIFNIVTRPPYGITPLSPTG